MKNNSLPVVGLGYRKELHDAIFHHASEIDCLEILTEHFFEESNNELLRSLLDKFQVIPHGLELSIGSTGINWEYLDKVKKIIEITGTTYYSDHLALTSVPGISFGTLTPIIPSKEQLVVIIDNVNRLQNYFQVPLVLENITELIQFPNAIPIHEFWQQLIDKTGCGLHLDITNLYVNSFNYGFDSLTEIMRWPLESVVHIHLSGGRTINGEKMDGHDSPIEDESWNLFKCSVGKMKKLKTVIIERDANFPNFSELLEEIRITRKTTDEVFTCQS